MKLKGIKQLGVVGLFLIATLSFSKVTYANINEGSLSLKVENELNLFELPSENAFYVNKIKKDENIKVFNINGDWALVSYSDNIGYVNMNLVLNEWSSVAQKIEQSKEQIKEEIKTSTNITENEIKNNVLYMNWEEVKKIFTLHEPAKVYDVLTGETYYVKSFSNGKHADVEPVTKEDTAIMYKTFNYNWSWEVRPVWVTINGVTLAGSINGMPHALGINDENNMDGQVCIHFIGSTTHNGNSDFTKVHQDVAKEAYELSLK